MSILKKIKNNLSKIGNNKDSDILIKNEILPEPILEFEPKKSPTRRILHDDGKNVIFMNSFNELGWSLKNVPDYALGALKEFVLLNGLINYHLHRVNKKKASQLLASRLYYCLTADGEYDTQEIFKDIKEYAKKWEGSVKQWTIETPKFAVYINRGNDVVWWYYQDIPEYMIGAFEEFESLKGLSSTTLPNSHKLVFMSKLASALANAFNKSEYESAKNCFKDVREYLSSKAVSFLKMKAFAISVGFSIASLAAIITLCITYPKLNIYLMGMGAGVVGAMVSSLQRNVDISLDNYAGEYILYCESLSRLIIGAVFGCFLVFGSNSELFLAPFKNNIQAIVCFCFISGFVERFVPDLIDGVVKKRVDDSQ